MAGFDVPWIPGAAPWIAGATPSNARTTTPARRGSPRCAGPRASNARAADHDHGWALTRQGPHVRVRALPSPDLGDGGDHPARQARAHRLVLGRLPMLRRIRTGSRRFDQLGIGSYRSAWLLAAKLRKAMRDPLSGLIEVDETALAFRTKNDPVAGGAGRRSERSPWGLAGLYGNRPQPRRQAARRRRRRGRRRQRAGPPAPGRIASYGAESLDRFRATTSPHASVTAKTDIWALQTPFVVEHDPHVIGSMAAHLVLPWIHQVFSNLKGWARGDDHGLRAKHLQSDEFVFRFNRRRTRSRLPLAVRHRRVHQAVHLNMLVRPEAGA